MNPELGDMNEKIEETGVVGLHEVLHESGLTFIDRWKMPTVASGPGGGILSGRQTKMSGRPLKIFGQLLDNPTFTDARTLKNAIVGDTDTVSAYPIYRPKGEAMTLVPGYKVLVSDKTKIEYSVVSDAYFPIQDKDIFMPVAEVAENTGLKVIGAIHGAGSGVTTGHFLFAHPDYKIPLCVEHDDYMMAGIMVRNSYGMDKSAYVEAMGIRMVCYNYNLWGDELGRESYKHYEVNAEKVYKMTHAVCRGIIEKAPKLKELVEKSSARPVKQSEIKDLAWAVGIPPTVAYEVYNAPSAFEHTIREHGLTAWTLYNAFTAARTHMDNRIMNMVKMDEGFRAIKRILYEPIDKLVSEGQKNRDDYVKSVIDAMKKKGMDTTDLKASDIVRV